MIAKKDVAGLIEMSGRPADFIRKLESVLRSNSRKGYEAERFAPGPDKAFETPVPVLKKIGEEVGKAGEKSPGKYFSLLRRMWKRGYREEKIIPAFALERMGKKDPAGSLKLVKSFLPGIGSWEVCDELAMRALGPLAESRPEDVLKLGKKCAGSRRKWERRFGAAAMIPFAHGKREINQNFFDVLEPLMEDREPDVKKAVAWALRELARNSPELVFRFLMKWTKNNDRNTSWIIRNGMKKLEKQKQEKILKILEGDHEGDIEDT